MLLYYHGSDAYRIRQTIADVIGHQNQEGLSVTRIDLVGEGQAEEFERELKYPSFFQSTRVIVIQNILANVQTAEQTYDILTRYDIAKDPSIIVIGVSSSENRPSAATKQLTAYLDRHAQSQSFELLTGAERVRWINDFCAQRDSSIQPTAITTLIGRLPPDGWALALELEKLCAYADGQTITSNMVTELVPLMDERNEFELTDALYAHNKRGIISALWRRLSDGTAEQLILGTLASGIRTMLIAQSLASRGLDTGAIAKTAGIHPFVAQKALRGANTYTEQQLRAAHGHLAQLDRSAKDGHADIIDSLMAVALEL